MIVMKIIYQAQSAAVNNTKSNAFINNYAAINASQCKLIIRKKRIKIDFTN
jgi:hypothetical protein